MYNILLQGLEQYAEQCSFTQLWKMCLLSYFSFFCGWVPIASSIKCAEFKVAVLKEIRGNLDPIQSCVGFSDGPSSQSSKWKYLLRVISGLGVSQLWIIAGTWWSRLKLHFSAPTVSKRGHVTSAWQRNLSKNYVGPYWTRCSLCALSFFSHLLDTKTWSTAWQVCKRL